MQIGLYTHAVLAYQLVIICLQWKLLAFMVPHCMREVGVSGAIILRIQLLLVLTDYSEELKQGALRGVQ
jgi:hypothetical protein